MKRRDALIGAMSSLTVPLEAVAAASPPSNSKGDLLRAEGAAALREGADIAILQNLLAGSALSADTGDTAYQTALYAEDAVMNVGGSNGEIHGRDAIVALITDAAHAKLRAEGMAHFAALPHIRVDGTRAVAVGYLQIMAPDASGNWVTWRLTANRWAFEHRDGRWQIVRRTIRPAPSAEALELLCLT